LRVIAFVQNDQSGEILQVVQAEVKGDVKEDKKEDKEKKRTTDGASPPTSKGTPRDERPLGVPCIFSYGVRCEAPLLFLEMARAQAPRCCVRPRLFGWRETKAVLHTALHMKSHLAGAIAPRHADFIFPRQRKKSRFPRGHRLSLGGV